MPRFNPEEYEDVHSRIRRFLNDHPDGSIQVDVLSDPNLTSHVVCRAKVYFDVADAMPRGVDVAQETAGGSGANANCWVENCSTSDIGRALANCGYSGDKRASREEMQKANRAGGNGNGYGNHSQPRNLAPVQAPDALPPGGKVQPCYKCSKRVYVVSVNGGKPERYNADGHLHYKGCDKGWPTGFDDNAPAAPSLIDEEDPFAE